MSNILKTLAAGSASEPTDEYFNQTTLLLHGDGTNGAQNNTFLDSSTNNFTITRNGNTTQGTFSPFSVADGEWSNYFDGSGDYLTTAASANFGVGTGTFSFECWIYPTANPANGVGTIFDARSSATPQGWVVRVFSDLRIGLYDGPNNLYVYSTGTVTLNQWQHIAIVRSSTSSGGVAFYIDGVASGTGTIASNLGSSWAAYIGRNYSTGFDFNGYVSNMRVVKNAVVYSSAFTPSSTPLQPFGSGTNALLSCQSNRFVDNSGNSLALTPTGNTSVQPFSPFAPSAAYDPSVNGGSGYFDGSGDYLVAPSSSAFGYGTGDFTISFWLYKTSTAASYIIDQRPSSTFYMLYVNGQLQVPSNNYGSAGSVKTNAWTHVVVSRVSGTTRIFTDGVQGTADADSSNYATSTLRLGEYNATGYPYLGYIADFHVQKGVGVTSVTVPTAPPTPTANTSLLLNFTNAGIFDNTGKNNLETVGNAQIDTSVKKYGTGSMEFDGTGDYLLALNSQPLGSGDFTIEGWVNFDGLVEDALVSTRDAIGASSTGMLIAAYSSLLQVYTAGAFQLTSTTTLSTGTWYHVAVVKSSGTTTLYLDGIAEDTYADSNNYTSSRVYVGGDVGGGYFLDGYIDDLRITKGVARYTTTFTPPSRAFPDL